MTKEAAQRRFKNFHERKPVAGEVVQIELTGRAVAFLVGDLDGLIYTTRDDGVKYVHQFKKSARPVLFASHDGRQIYVLAGAYSFTDRGFEDRSPKKGKKKP